jgi:hypothetical protein
VFDKNNFLALRADFSCLDNMIRVICMKNSSVYQKQILVLHADFVVACDVILFLLLEKNVSLLIRCCGSANLLP